VGDEAAIEDRLDPFALVSGEELRRLRRQVRILEEERRS
jgi:hypothetical protein